MNNWTAYKWQTFFIPIIAGIALLSIPLVGDFHIESAILISLVGCFWAGISATNKSTERDFHVALQITGYLFLIGLPLLVNALLTGCFSIHGLAYWLLFPLPSVFFGYAIGRLIRSLKLSYAKAITVGILLFIGIGILLIELLTYPQVYFFNHVWGGWPGPIYDEVVRVNRATGFFRMLTLLWAILLWHIPVLDKDRYSKWVVGFSAVAILISYTQLTELGINSPRSHLQKVLGGHQSTEHFELYYHQRLYSDYEINLLAKEHEFYFDQISNQLALTERDTADKIESYLYGHPWQKKELVGAKFTSYVPVWLEQDQLHIAKEQISSSLKHELVHVMSKKFGNWFNASWTIGLIEGIAVAIDGGSSSTSTIHQLVVSEKPYPSAEELERAFSFWGFYGGRSGVNYTTSGSFVRFLMQNYPIEYLKKAYQTGGIAEAYQTDWQTLTSEWHAVLDTVDTDTIDQQVARRIFGMRSLFEKECPHVVSDFATAHDNYRFSLANQDTARALQFLDRALVEADSTAPIKTGWSYRNLIEGQSPKVRQAAVLVDTTVDLQLLYADAFAMVGDWEMADRHLSEGKQLFEENSDSLLKPALETRNNRLQWEIYRQMTYDNMLPDSAAFNEALYRTKIRSVRKAIEQEKWQMVELYAHQLLEASLDKKYFDDYQQLIHYLIFQNNIVLAKQLMVQLSKLPLRNRYRDRLQQEWEWVEFLKTGRENGSYD
ncbi:hypothetical protein CK503_03555 [Aliifodinibius salipaludis]|uniref:Uncharacterized protein n=1 Tax=Fodinibius salipaludis TaxID=2032627 RepID=A0A2A2GEH1_9BACT|nr:hypothetical protein [Aliifodinibius salipaludis]PAU95283.1 hypothetical protein CK503_03555 [Aliifodinibius salipaludis]